MIRRYLFVLFLCVFTAALQGVCVNGAIAQQSETTTDSYTLIFKGVSLDYAIQKLVKKTHMRLIYDPAIMTDHRVYTTARNKNAEDILRLLLKGSGLDFIQLSSGTYVLTTAPQKQLQDGHLVGRVIDRATGNPLVGANIVLLNGSGGASTNRAGYFSIPNLANGPHKIAITYVGYKPVQDTVWVPSNQTTKEQFSMTSQPVFVKPIIVSGIQRHLPAADAFTSKLYSSDIATRPARGGVDAIKSLGMVTGIHFDGPTADFNIQGGQTGAHQLQLDGVPIYNPVSMGRLLGAFSPFAIDKVTLSKAGFASPVGSQLSGVINLHQGVSHAADSLFLMQLNPLNINGRLSHTFDIKDGPKIDFMVAARKSVWRWFKKPALKQTLHDWDRIDPLISNHLLQLDSTYTYFKPQKHSYNINYYDLHFAGRITHNPFHQTYVSAYHGKNILETTLLSQNITFSNFAPELFYSIDRYNWTNTMAKVAHQWLINAHFDVGISGYITHHSLNHKYIITNNRQQNLQSSPTALVGKVLETKATDEQLMGDKNALIESSLQLSLNYNASKNYHLKGALSVKHLDYQFHLSEQYYQASVSSSNSLLVAGFVQNNFFLSKGTSFSVGSRFTFVPSRDLVFAEPRFSFNYDAHHSALGDWSAKLSGGIYRQFINQFDVTNVGPSTLVPSIRFWVPVDYTTTVPKAYHIAGNWLWEPVSSLQFQLESYYKWIPARLALDYQELSAMPLSGFNEFTINSYKPNTVQQEFISQAKGYAYGLALSVEKTLPVLDLQLNSRYEYSVSRQRIPSRFSGNYQPVPWSQPHQLSASAQWNLKPNFTLLLQWKGIWGRSWGFRQAYYDYLSLQGQRSYGQHYFNNPANDKLPLYAQLNASISYQHQLQDSRLQFRLDLFNILNHKNVLNWWLSPYTDEAGEMAYHKRERLMQGFSPSLSIKFNY